MLISFDRFEDHLAWKDRAMACPSVEVQIEPEFPQPATTPWPPFRPRSRLQSPARA